MRKRGFTLVEILIVIAIVGVLAAITIVSISGARQRAQDTQVMTRLSGVRTALSQFEIDRRAFPIHGETAPERLGGVALSELASGTDSLVPNYLRSNTALLFENRQNRYLSTLDGRSYRMAVELLSPHGTVVTTGNGIYSLTTHSAVTGDNSVTIAGQRSPALRLDGGQDIVVGPAGFGNVAGGQLTLSFWIRNLNRTAPLPVFNSIVVSNLRFRTSPPFDSTASGYAVQFRRINSQIVDPLSERPHISFLWGSSPHLDPRGAHFFITPSDFNTLFTNNWSHVVITKNNSSHVLYLNGIARNPDFQESGDSITGNDDVFRIASEPVESSGVPRLVGDLDDIRVYRTALSATEVSNLFNQGAGRFSTRDTANLVLGLRLDEGTGTILEEFVTGHPSSRGTITNQANRTHSWIEGPTSTGLSNLCTSPCINGANTRVFVVYGPQ